MADILDAIEAVGNHLMRGTLSDGLVFDAVRLRLIEIGEPVKRVSPEVMAAGPDIPRETSPTCGTGLRTAISIHPTPSCRPPSIVTGR
ncbi:MAG: hypothetical protein ACLPR9_15815 [Acidimicrobiales bacterium]